MKHLTITFAIAVGLICSAVVYNMVQHNTAIESSAVVSKTIVEKDAMDRVSIELTMVISGNRWVERSKKIYAYTPDCVIETMYNSVSGEWVASTKKISTYYNNSLIETVSYTLADGLNWIERRKESFDDLSCDDGLMHDMVFDKDGKLLMSATYKWAEDNVTLGVEKKEYVYDENGMANKHITYCWVGNTWEKTEVSDILYISQRTN